MMNLSAKEIELLNIIRENPSILEGLVDKAEKTEEKCVRDLQPGGKDIAYFAGCEWYKLGEDEKGNSIMHMVKPYKFMKFGGTNDWTNSYIRKELSENLFQRIHCCLGVDSLVPIKYNLLSIDGSGCYGKSIDYTSIPNFELFRENRKNYVLSDDYEWLCTPWSTPEGTGDEWSTVVSPYGDVYCNYYYYDYIGVRPICILKSSILVSLVSREE